MQYKRLASRFALLALVLSMSTAAFAAETRQGKVLAVSDGKLTMMDETAHKQVTHEIAANANILCESKKCGLSDVKAGDLVAVTIDQAGNKAVVTRIEVKKAADAS